MRPGEDLEGYAGAGLYDSVPMHHWREEPVSHDSDPIMSDSELRRQVRSQSQSQSQFGAGVAHSDPIMSDPELRRQVQVILCILHILHILPRQQAAL